MSDLPSNSLCWHIENFTAEAIFIYEIEKFMFIVGKLTPAFQTLNTQYFIFFEGMSAHRCSNEGKKNPLLTLKTGDYVLICEIQIFVSPAYKSAFRAS